MSFIIEFCSEIQTCDCFGSGRVELICLASLPVQKSFGEW